MTNVTPNLLLYGPQARFPSAEELDKHYRVLRNHPSLLQDIVATINELPILFQQLATADTSLSRVPAAASLSLLKQWLQSGHLSEDADDLPNVAALPLTVVLQTVLYLQYMDQTETTRKPKDGLQSLKQYGVQGFCTGFLTAAATAFSENEEQLSRNIATSVCLAMCLGAYVDQNTMYAEPPSPAYAWSVRWKHGSFSVAQVRDMLKDYPTVSGFQSEQAKILTSLAGIYFMYHG